MHLRISCFLCCAVLLIGAASTVLLSTPVFAWDVDIQLTETPTVNAELIAYVDWIEGDGRHHQVLVGFNGEDVGQGAGNGVDGFIAIPLVFPPFDSIESAVLTLELTPKNGLITTG